MRCRAAAGHTSIISGWRVNNAKVTLPSFMVRCLLRSLATNYGSTWMRQIAASGRPAALLESRHALHLRLAGGPQARWRQLWRQQHGRHAQSRLRQLPHVWMGHISQLTIELDRARAQQVPTRTMSTRAAANAAAAKSSSSTASGGHQPDPGRGHKSAHSRQLQHPSTVHSAAEAR